MNLKVQIIVDDETSLWRCKRSNFYRWTLEPVENDRPVNVKLRKLLKAANDFYGYISNNRDFIPNYGD